MFQQLNMDLSYDDLVAMDALGQLDPADAARLRSLGSDGNPRSASESTEAVSLLWRSLLPVDPPPHVRTALLTAIRRPRAVPDTLPNTVRTSEGAWRALPFPGVCVKELAVDPSRNMVTMLLRMDPGSVFPGHPHHGPEECYVVEGSVRLGHLLLAAGDFQHADAGILHDVSVSDTGCTLLLVVDRADYPQA